MVVKSVMWPYYYFGRCITFTMPSQTMVLDGIYALRVQSRQLRNDGNSRTGTSIHLLTFSLVLCVSSLVMSDASII